MKSKSENGLTISSSDSSFSSSGSAAAAAAGADSVAAATGAAAANASGLARYSLTCGRYVQLGLALAMRNRKSVRGGREEEGGGGDRQGNYDIFGCITGVSRDAQDFQCCGIRRKR